MSTTHAAWGKVIVARQEGKPIPPDWGVDSRGQATTDANEAVASLPPAATRAIALALMIEILCAHLAGVPFGTHVTKMYGELDKPRNLGHFMLALDVARFTDPTVFRSQLDSPRERDPVSRTQPTLRARRSPPATPSASPPRGAARRHSARQRGAAQRAQRARGGSSALRPSSDRIDPLRRDAELCGRGADLSPGFRVHGDAFAFPLGARLALRLAGDAHAVEPRRRGRFADPVEIVARLTRERISRVPSFAAIDHDREHAVQHAALGALRIVPGAACR